MASFAETLISWYDDHKRDLPWRGETDPYKIWVSEIILQQTRVQQGWDYYHRFLDNFPNVKTLAEADEEKVLKVWQGLGYYSRARNMHAAAREIMAEHHGIFPQTYDKIRSLKGIGNYTAAAIASIAFHLPYPAVDGNVIRIVSRIFGICDDVTQPAVLKRITAQPEMRRMSLSIKLLRIQKQSDRHAAHQEKERRIQTQILSLYHIFI